jgi:hypothetical protein
MRMGSHIVTSWLQHGSKKKKIDDPFECLHYEPQHARHVNVPSASAFLAAADAC